MKNLFLFSLIGMVILAAILTVVQIWTMFLAWDVFLKVLGTLAIIFCVVGLIHLMVNELGKGKRLKDENYLD